MKYILLPGPPTSTGSPPFAQRGKTCILICSRVCQFPNEISRITLVLSVLKKNKSKELHEQVSGLWYLLLVLHSNFDDLLWCQVTGCPIAEKLLRCGAARGENLGSEIPRSKLFCGMPWYGWNHNKIPKMNKNNNNNNNNNNKNKKQPRFWSLLISIISIRPSGSIDMGGPHQSQGSFPEHKWHTAPV